MGNEGAGPHRRRPIVAIDGPAGAGKSTLARAMASELRLPYINTGLMYRALAARAVGEGIDPEDGEGLGERAAAIAFDLRAVDAIPELLIDGRAPDPGLTSSEVEAVVSTVSRHSPVRAVLRARQRSLGKDGCVMEGRDIGTVVFPDADVKIFLSAPADVRAGRRVRERAEPGEGPDALAEAVSRRDALDAVTNPLVPAPDAHVLDTRGIGKAEVLAAALRIVRDALDDRDRPRS